MTDKIINRGMKLQSDLKCATREQFNHDTINPQLLWNQFKSNIKCLTKQDSKETHHKIASHMTKLRKDLQEISHHPDFNTNKTLGTMEAILAHELVHLKKIQAKNKKDRLQAEIASHGEKLGGVWSTLNKENKPCDLICCLKVPNSNPPQYKCCSKRMAQLAYNYHEQLQQSPPDDLPDRIDYNTQLDNILSKIPANQKKTLHNLHDNATRSNQTGFNITKTFTIILNDIRLHGVDPHTDFTQGWMCPVFKKKDHIDISNYRPITLLNMDYKILTKVLAIQLMEHIHQLVHKDQASFIPWRQIFSHIHLAQSILTYAETSGTNGAIVALDQEKAYDRIYHNYLWQTLESFHIPQPFISTIKSLYQHATTTVAINGILSLPFRVQCGIQQGDPLSCPLFDLAIEPLACNIRSDPLIIGIDIPNTPHNPKIKLFADNTMLFLTEHDSLDKIHEILDHWCHVLGAKFNTEKTEIVPIRTEEYRSSLHNMRKLNPQDLEPLNDDIHIAPDNTAIHLLGAWISNHTNATAPWEPVLDKIKKDLEQWGKSKPTLYGRKIIIQAVIGGHTQFLTKAQGMPTTIETALTKMIWKFMWEDDSSPRIAYDILCSPLSKGGLNLLNIQARNEAIEIIWLKSYLDFSPLHPAWATITDLIINKAAPPGTSQLARMNAFLQSWDIPSYGARLNLLNDTIIRMIKTAKKYQANIAAICLPLQLCTQLPAWYHPFATPHSMATTPARCLLWKHTVMKVTDLLAMSDRIQTPNPH